MPDINPYESPKSIGGNGRDEATADHDRPFARKRSLSAADVLGLVLLSLASTVIATAILSCGISGPIGLLTIPFLMLFGWFYAPIVIGLHFLAWFIWRMLEPYRWSRFSFCVAGALIGASLFAKIGVKGVHQYDTILYAGAAAVGGTFSCLAICWPKNEPLTDRKS